MKPALGIGVCSNRPWSPHFATCLMRMIVSLNGDPSTVSQVIFRQKTQVSILPDGRHQVIGECIAEGATHLLLIDDDMTFPADVPQRLLAHGKRVVGVNYRAKTKEPMVTALDLNGGALQPGKGLEEVSSLGFGIMLIDADVFRRVEPPHFEIRWTGRGYGSDDRFFCNRIRDCGEHIFCDHDLSKEVCHLGEFAYSLRGSDG